MRQVSKASIWVLALVAVFVVLCDPVSASAHPHILRISDGVDVGFKPLVDDLAGARLVFMGELHDNVGHHGAQLAVIAELHARGRPLAIGLEMVRKKDQEVLDRWVRGEISEEEFLATYRQHWSIWEPYRPIFFYARRMKIPMVGLNISRELTGRVSKEGFASLGEAQREELGGITCTVSPAYERFIRRAMGEHAPHGAAFGRFCEAQLLWDKIMARNLDAFVAKNRDVTVVVLAGGGHAWKYGIPAQLTISRSDELRVVLPEGSSAVNRVNVTPEDADYYWLDFGPEGWGFNDQRVPGAAVPIN